MFCAFKWANLVQNWFWSLIWSQESKANNLQASKLENAFFRPIRMKNVFSFSSAKTQQEFFYDLLYDLYMLNLVFISNLGAFEYHLLDKIVRFGKKCVSHPKLYICMLKIYPNWILQAMGYNLHAWHLHFVEDSQKTCFSWLLTKLHFWPYTSLI